MFCGREQLDIIVAKTDTNFAKANCVETPARHPGRLLGQRGEDRAESEETVQPLEVRGLLKKKERMRKDGQR